jgi:predicted enzyme related to lactoylglutathione lyase
MMNVECDQALQFNIEHSPFKTYRSHSTITTLAEGIGFEVDNVDAMVTTLRAKETTVKLEPCSTPVCRMAVILDPEGNALPLHQATQSW